MHISQSEHVTVRIIKSCKLPATSACTQQLSKEPQSFVLCSGSSAACSTAGRQPPKWLLGSFRRSWQAVLSPYTACPLPPIEWEIDLSDWEVTVLWMHNETRKGRVSTHTGRKIKNYSKIMQMILIHSIVKLSPAIVAIYLLRSVGELVLCALEPSTVNLLHTKLVGRLKRLHNE